MFPLLETRIHYIHVRALTSVVRKGDTIHFSPVLPIVHTYMMDLSQPFDEKFMTKVDGFVKIDVEQGGEEPISVPALLNKAVQRAPSATALAVKRNGHWIKWTYEKYLKVIQIS